MTLDHDVLVAADMIGIAAFTLSGFLVGVRNKLDLLGVIVSSCLTAVGGSIIRDTILNEAPFVFTQLYPITIILVVLIFAFLIKPLRTGDIENRWLFVISSTLGLVSFSIAGALAALEVDFNLFGIIILSFLTATGGGLLRDTMINQVPQVLISDFYGSIAIIVALLIYAIQLCGCLNSWSVAAIGIFSFTLRLVAYKRNWQLPQVVN